MFYPFAKTANTQGLYHFDGNANDASGNGNNQTVNGAVLDNGRFGQGYNLNGSSDYMGITLPANLKTANFSCGCWVKIDVNDSQNIMVALTPRGAGGIGSGWYSYTSNAGKLVISIGENAPWISTTGNTVLSTGIWYFLGSSFNGTNLNVYLNGNLDNSSAPGGSIYWTDSGAGNYPDPAQFYIGAGKSNTLGGGATVPDSGFFNGVIDEVIIENRAWSAEEWKAKYNKGRIIYGRE